MSAGGTSLGISNIAWDPAEDDAVGALLARHGVRCVDVAPGKYFPDPERCTAAEVERVRRAWEARGVALAGMQSLLFGTSGLALFGPAPVQDAMLARLAAVCRVGAGLGATRLVFGSPRNRDRRGLDETRALAVAVAFFRRLGDAAAGHGVVVCLEANTPNYGCNFMTSTAEAAAVVRAVAHPAIRLQLDLGTVATNGEPLAELLAAHGGLVGHVHLSEPGLAPLGTAGSPHAEFAAAMRGARLPRPAVIEMLAVEPERRLATIDAALAHAVALFGESAS